MDSAWVIPSSFGAEAWIMPGESIDHAWIVYGKSTQVTLIAAILADAVFATRAANAINDENFLQTCGRKRVSNTSSAALPLVSLTLPIGAKYWFKSSLLRS